MTRTQKILISVFLYLAATAFPYSPPSAEAASYSGIWGDNQHEWITNVTFGAINNTSGPNGNGYGDYTYDKSGLTTRVRANGTYPLSVTIHPDLDWCDEFLTAFFDWNHDGDFADAGESVVLATRTCSPGPHTVNVKVPSNARGGEVRMRIVLKYYNPPPSFGDIDEGEAEDYTILVDYPTIIGDNRGEWITNVTIGGINNSSASNSNGYGDYTYWTTGRTTEVVQDQRHRLSVSIVPDLDWCGENITAFLDWNHEATLTTTAKEWSSPPEPAPPVPMLSTSRCRSTPSPAGPACGSSCAGGTLPPPPDTFPGRRRTTPCWCKRETFPGTCSSRPPPAWEDSLRPNGKPA